MSRFFINRPIFAWVISIFIALLGCIAIFRLPILAYPSVAPPTININFAYPGASAKTVEEAVVGVVEREMNGSPGLLYMESAAQANGTGSITLSFSPETNPDMAQVDVQNRLSRVTSRLPSVVVQSGLTVDKARSNTLKFVMLSASDNAGISLIDLADYVSRNVLPELQRLPGVGQASLFASEKALRIWLDPDKLAFYRLSVADVRSAIQSQNIQVSPGSLGDLPIETGQGLSFPVTVSGQLTDPTQFGSILLRSNADGSALRLRDVARIELGAQSYSTSVRNDGKPSVAVAIQLSPTGNALDVAQLVDDKMTALQKYFPAGVSYSVPYDSSLFVSSSVSKVVQTLIEAMVLVFLVMFLFLQNWRYTLIPTIAVPVALLGAFFVVWALGLSINTLTLFGMVLVIGIVVDDAIVVIENVERIMREEKLNPKEATVKAMGQISGAVVGMTLVLISVFIPLAFFSGAIGSIYKQFSVVIVAAIAFSAFVALSLSPALCATLLKPHEDAHQESRFFGWFNRFFVATTQGYMRAVGHVVKKLGRYMLVYGVIVLALGWIYWRLPTSFLPAEDQGFIAVNVQLPSGASQKRTFEVMTQVEAFFMKQPEVNHVITIMGRNFSGQAQNAGMVYARLKPWSERSGEANSAQALAGRAFGALAPIKDAVIFPVTPPPIPELGNASGFSLRLQDRADLGRDALLAARGQLLGLASQNPLLAQVRPDGLEDATQLELVIDREKAAAYGVSFDSIGSALAGFMGSSYVNDFPNAGRMQRVILQAEGDRRSQPNDILSLNVINKQGKAVPLSSFARTKWVVGPLQTVRYNGFSSMRISGGAAPGVSTGQAMEEMEKLMTQLPAGIGYEWTGISREEKQSGSQVGVLYALAILAVFLCLAALYESWAIPFSVILVVPLGVVGVMIATWLRGYSNDVYFQIALVTIIGLSAKNAILIIEFAKDLREKGLGIFEATMEAAKMRFRPIIMTSMAFILGVLPLTIASGAGSASQRVLGTGVLGGMISATVLAVLFVPIFFVLVERLLEKFSPSKKQNNSAGHSGEQHE
jgi:multidrug efflux pump